MNSSQIFNPMTTGRVIRRSDGSEALELRCYARRRSFRPLRIERAAEPELFAGVLGWLEGDRPPNLPGLDNRREIELWADGLLLSPKELKFVPPGAAPEMAEGHGLAALLCPGVAELLRHGPAMPMLPSGPDPDLLEYGFCSLPSQIAASDRQALGAFYAALSDGDWFEQSDDPDARRKIIHNDPAARRIHHALTPAMSVLAGQSLKPSYTFASEYGGETALARHTDREQCEYTFSLYVDYAPDPGSNLCPWPLTVHAPEGDRDMHQTLGGGLLMRGRTLPHSRPPLPPGHRARMAFLHYVPVDFTGSLD